MLPAFNFFQGLSPAKIVKIQKKSLLVHNRTNLSNKEMRESNYFCLPSLKRPGLRGRKTLSITLKMPNIDLTGQRTSSLKIKPCIEIIRTSSVSGKYRNNSSERDSSEPRPLRQTMISFQYDKHPNIIPYCFSPIRSKYSPLPQRTSKIKHKKINIPELIIKGEKKIELDNSLDNTMYTYLIDFYQNVKQKYHEFYNNIDRLGKGFMEFDDIIDYFILKDIENKEKNYDEIRECANSIYKVLVMISKSKNVYKRHFFGFCSVFEHNNKGGELDLKDKKTVSLLKEQILELKELFECYTDGKVINLRSILGDINLKDKITKCRVFVESEKVDFSRFLMCLPFFVWMYNAINSQVS